MDVAILTQREHLVDDPDHASIRLLHIEEALLAEALRAQGLRVQRVAWDDPTCEWSLFRAVIVRSTWDYFLRRDEFVDWVARVAAQTRLFNSAELLRWNVDKRYLAALQQAGIPVVDTVFVDRGAHTSLADLQRAFGWPELVFKPCVSANAHGTFRVRAGELAGMEATFAASLASQRMIVQPFVSSIVDQGELSLVTIAGRCTHAVRKLPKSGDFRVQDDHGGTVLAHALSEREVAFAERVIAACLEPPLYARVDVVSEGQQLRVMELELIEPELFLRFCPLAAHHLAVAVAAEL